jgi:hypothetical protein
MPHLSVYVDPRTFAILERESMVSGLSVEQLAAKAVESSAIATLPGGHHYPAGFNGDHWPRDHEVDLGGVSIGLRENHDGSMSVTPWNQPSARLTNGGVGVPGFDSFNPDNLVFRVTP